jgi:phosphorylase kinase alpha/beta subunit
LPTISFPAFATHDMSFYESTKEKIIEKLEGHYGFKRFVRDGFGSSVEGAAAESDGGERGYYAEGKIQEFHQIESEWPLFYALLVIDGVFKKDDEQVEKYQDLLRKRLTFNEYGGGLRTFLSIYFLDLLYAINLI